MEINSRIFGKIEIDDNKIITIPNGLLGFEKYTRYVIAYDSDKESKNGIMWLQCVDEPELAFPVMDPMFIIKDYRPVVEDEWLAQIGIFESDEELYVLSVLTVPSDLTKMTINLKAPIVINISTRLGCQIIVNNEEYPIRYSVYDCFNKKIKGGRDMLALTRKSGESIVINNDVEITVLDIKGDQVKIGITAPKSVPVYRKEVYIQIQEANKAASNSDGMEALKNFLK